MGRHSQYEAARTDLDLQIVISEDSDYTGEGSDFTHDLVLVDEFDAL